MVRVLKVSTSDVVFKVIIVGSDNTELEENMSLSRGQKIKRRLLVFLIFVLSLGTATAGNLLEKLKVKKKKKKKFFLSVRQSCMVAHKLKTP